MKLDVMRPATLIDINALQDRHGAIEVGPKGLRIGALARMADVGDHPDVVQEYPVVSQSLLLAASTQLRNMALLKSNFFRQSFDPRPRAGGDIPLVVAAVVRDVSIHAPVQGATLDLRRPLRQIGVSIHAPVQGGDTGAALTVCDPAAFRSTPPCRGRQPCGLLV